MRVRRPTLSSLRSSWAYHTSTVAAWWKASLWNRLILLAVCVYGTVFSILTILRIYALSAFAWDLGIYNQAMYDTISGRFFYLPGVPGGPAVSLFGYHFSPILLLLLVPYSLFPSPVSLVVIQSWGVASAALPIYLLSQNLLHSDRFSFAIGLVFLLDPATQGINWYDFHPQAFLLLTVGGALYFMETRRWTASLASTVLALSTQETVSILVAVVGLGAVVSEWWDVRTVGRAWDRVRLRFLTVMLALAAVWYVVAQATLNSQNPYSVPAPAGFGSWAVLGASSVVDIPLTAILHPTNALAALATDADLKIWFLIILFAPVQFLTFRSPRSVFYCLPWLIVALLSNDPAFYQVGDQYPSFVLPFVFYGAILGLARPWSPLAVLRRMVSRPVHVASGVSGSEQYTRSLVAVTVVLLIVVSPLGPWALGSATTGSFPVVGPHEHAVLDLVALVPPSASVLTQDNLFPLLSSRIDAHFVPLNVMFTPGSSFNQTMDSWTTTVDYILLDLQTNFVEGALLLSWPNVSAHYSIVGAADGALLLERGSHGISFFEPMVRTFDHNGVVPVNASLVADAAAEDGYALLHANLTTSHFWYGPFLALPPGVYTVTYRLKVDRQSIGNLLGLPVILHPVVLNASTIDYPSYGKQVFFEVDQLATQVFVNATSIQGASVPVIGSYFDVSTDFTVTTLGVYELPGLGAAGSVRLWFDDLTVVQRMPSLTGTLPVKWS